MTEEEAKTKWCPFVRFASDVAGEARFNRGNVDPMNLTGEGDDFVPRCIASACMAWRPLEPAPGTVSDKSDPAAKSFRMSDVRDYEAHGGWLVERLPDTGFCGLATKP